MKHLTAYKLFESTFVSKEEVDILLDKISQSGITSLSDIEKNRLTLFSEQDREIIDTIEKMGDLTRKFKEVNAEMRRCQDSGESDGFHLMDDWLKLNNQLRPLQASFRKWGIELGDERLTNLMRKQRPDVYNTNIFESKEDIKASLDEICYDLTDCDKFKIDNSTGSVLTTQDAKKYYNLEDNGEGTMKMNYLFGCLFRAFNNTGDDCIGQCFTFNYDEVKDVLFRIRDFLGDRLIKIMLATKYSSEQSEANANATLDEIKSASGSGWIDINDINEDDKDQLVNFIILYK